MTDIQFAKEHMGEYFHLGEYMVRVIGYDSTGIGNSVIVDHPAGWWIELAEPVDVTMVECRTGGFMYSRWEDLK